jgi:hypothetical protein
MVSPQVSSASKDLFHKPLGIVEGVDGGGLCESQKR